MRSSKILLSVCFTSLSLFLLYLMFYCCVFKCKQVGIALSCFRGLHMLSLWQHLKYNQTVLDKEREKGNKSWTLTLPVQPARDIQNLIFLRTSPPPPDMGDIGRFSSSCYFPWLRHAKFDSAVIELPDALTWIQVILLSHWVLQKKSLVHSMFLTRST